MCFGKSLNLYILHVVILFFLPKVIEFRFNFQYQRENTIFTSCLLVCGYITFPG